MLDILLRNWLQNAAKQKLYQAARERVSQGADQAEVETEFRERPCDVGVVFALENEAGGLKDRLAGLVNTHAAGCKFQQGGLEGRHVVLVQSGAGRAAAAAATQSLIAGHRPKCIISAGFASGMQPQLKRFDIVIADELADTAGNRIALELNSPTEARQALPNVHVGRLLTVNRLIRKPAEKRSLGQEHQALACDTESLAVAEVCRQDQIALLVIRIVSDTIDDELPADVDRLSRQQSTAGLLGAALGALVNRPSSVKDLFKLQEDALVCSDRLAKFLESVILQLARRNSGRGNGGV